LFLAHRLSYLLMVSTVPITWTVAPRRSAKR
jgi:hypothetical protein